MKKTLYLLIVLIPLLYFSCSSDDENDPFVVENNVVLPKLTDKNPLAAPLFITITGKGFKDSDTFFFTLKNDELGQAVVGQGRVQKVTDEYVELLTPTVHGRQSVTMRRGNKVYQLGILYFTQEEKD